MSVAAAGLRYRSLWLATGWTLVALLVLLSLLPAGADPLLFPGADKLEHALAYGVLMGWFMQLYRAAAWPRVATALIALGALLELLQALTETRSFDLLDLAADMLGIAAAWRLLRPPFTELLLRAEQRLLRH